MFNRMLQVKMIKTKKGEEGIVVEEDFDEQIVVVGEIVRELMWEAGKMYAGYIVLDTFRQVLITLAAKPYK
jgi:hypothetical protein